MKRIPLFLIVVAVLFSLPACTKKDQITDGVLTITGDQVHSLTGTWQFRYGDDQKWASEIGDSEKWQTVAVPGSTPEPKTANSFWYRLIIQVAPDANLEEPLFLSLSRFYQAYEVYLNGRKIGGRGIVPEKDKPEDFDWAIGGMYTVINSTDLGPDDNILAVRAYAEGTLDTGNKYTYSYLGPYTLTSRNFFSMVVANIMISLIAFFSGVFYLIGFKDRSHRAQLYINLTGIFSGLSFLVVWLPDLLTTPNTQWLYSLSVSLFLLCIIFIMKFANVYYSRQLSIVLRFEKPATYLIAAMALVPIITLNFTISSLLLKAVSAFFLLSIPVNVIFTLSEPARKKTWEYYVIAGAALFSLVCVAIDGLTEANIARTPLPDFVLVLTPYGLLVIILAFSWIRGRNLEERLVRYQQTMADIAAKRNKKYERNLLEGVNITDLEAKLTELMAERKVHRTEDISLHQMAGELGITGHQLSQYLNDNLKMNFNSFINKYRVEDAQAILTEDLEASILSIAYHVGFNSKSSFNRAFLKNTGTTPQKYRQNHLDSKSGG